MSLFFDFRAKKLEIPAQLQAFPFFRRFREEKLHFCRFLVVWALGVGGCCRCSRCFFSTFDGFDGFGALSALSAFIASGASDASDASDTLGAFDTFG
ncbi:hypothetical protein HQN90_17315 [Paenibacillus alba]|uniref:hypothetical protein n=1 Tax=Paenibacillus alba TaxID=1197127 RepID=UPI0015658149|nr:hypothetical protein [Paenibacillus alba]NQX67883.1 hypothetical protein [Paenibacillus alba]